MQLLFLLFVILTSSTTKTHSFLEEHDSCYSTQDVTVSYTLWIGTQVNENHTIVLTVKQYKTLYDVMKIAKTRNHQQYT
jgi:hypothetical protein